MKVLHSNSVRLFFVREFTKGPLKGLQQEDSLPFVNESLSKEWLAGIARNSLKGSINYRVISSKIESL